MQQVSKIRQQVSRLLRECHITSPAVKVEDVAHYLGLVVIKEPFEGDVSGVLLQKASKSIIGINSMHSSQRQRFTCAHEIGHYLLHKPTEPHFDRKVLLRNTVSSTATDAKEIEANRFAAELLMPYSWLTKDLSNPAHDDLEDRGLEKLARRYDVSLQAMTVRLSSLGLLKF